MKVDDRFSSIQQDRRFNPIRAKQRKVEIDGRFQSMFTDPRFKLQYKVDKRGLPVNESSSENLKKYYRLPKKKSKSCEKRLEKRQHLKQLLAEETPDELPVNEVVTDGAKESTSEESDSEESSDDEPDLARGEGNVESSTDEDETDEEEEDGESETVAGHCWGELDVDAERSEEIGHRLALCNMDWDKVRALDILVLLNSFKPPEGTVKKVTIYPSEFGAKRLAEEAKQGPAELRSNRPLNENDDGDNELVGNKEGQRYQVEKLREYQINRLKYYYAIIECDSAETANTIYQECDGLEYETSSTKLDLRFVPDDTTFDETPKESADRLPDKDQYKAPEFVTTALNQSKVDLTWDETDRKRLATTMRKFTEKELESLDLEEFLASSSGSDEDEPEPESSASRGVLMSLSRTTTEDQIARYRSLLLGDDEPSDDAPSDIDMEMTWEPGPNELVSKEEDDSNVTEATKTTTDSEKRSRKEKDEAVNTENDEKQKAELEMIMMDGEDTKKRHFNMNELIKDEQKSKKRKKRDAKEEEQKDDFEINLSDSRFTAIYTSSDFALDPNNPAFKSTKAMNALVHERQNRLDSGVTIDDIGEVTEGRSEEPSNDAGLASLISSIKAKTKLRLSKKNKKA